MKQKISDMMNEAYMEELLELEPVPVDAEAVKRRTFAKLGMAPSAEAPPERRAAKATPYLRRAGGGKRSRKVLRVLAVAVALLVALTTLVYAASVIYGMMQQKVGYFETEGDGSTPVSGPVYHGALAMDIEQYNAEVGASVDGPGKTVTLDTVAIDDNFINAFFTVAYEQPIDLEAAMEGPYPAYAKLRYAVPWFTVRADGKELEGGFSTLDEYDPYMADDRTIKMMVRWVVPTTLLDVFELTLEGQDKAVEGQDAAPGEYRYTLAVDKSASAAATRAAEAGEYTLQTADGARTLDLQKLAVTPFGAVLSVKGHWSGEDLNPDPAYLMPENLYITDDKGNVLNSFWNNVVASNAPYYAIELIGGVADARSVTLTPILEKTDFSDAEPRSYSVSDIGAKIEINSLGGYYLEDYVVEDSRVSLVLRPYGRCNYVAGGIIINDDNVSLAEGRSGLINEQIDRKTGLLTYSVDYYAATSEELRAIDSFTVYYDGALALDESAALTLELAAPAQ